MGHTHHSHGHCHHHHHHHGESSMSDQRLALAVALNLFLTIAEVIAALVSGSLALMADALHNFSDCASLVVAWIARKISKRGADDSFTFGYKRAEIIGATINLTALIVLGGYLLIEAVMRFLNPGEIHGGVVIWVSAIAIIVDVGTALALLSMSKDNLNIRAAFLHNITDALSSVVVLLGGVAIIKFGWNWIDPLLTLLIAAYILKQSIPMLKKAIHLLMDGVDMHIDVPKVHQTLEEIPSIVRIYHLHIRHIDESLHSLEARVVIEPGAMQNMEKIKACIRHTLKENFQIEHSTLELELSGDIGSGAEEEHPCGYPYEMAHSHNHPADSTNGHSHQH